MVAVLLAALLVGAASGAVVQKFVGVGNVLRGVGIPYPTRQAPPAPVPGPAFEIPEAHQGRLHLFLLAGQSNMSGWAPLPPTQAESEGVYVFGNDYRWRAAREPVDDPEGQVDEVSVDRSARFGPAVAFAQAITRRTPGMAVGLVPCAKSSSAILDWQRNLSDRSLYGSCLKRARAASPMGRVSGVLFFQGETDAADPERYARFRPRASDWSSLFAAFVSDLRDDLGEQDLPVVFAQIGTVATPDEMPNWELVRAQQREVSLPFVAMIATDDLSRLDEVHFTADSYRVIGERFAEAYLSMDGTARHAARGLASSR